MAGRLGLPIGDRGNLDTDIFILCEEVRREEKARLLRKRGRNVFLDSSHLVNMAYARARSSSSDTQAFAIYEAYFTTALKYNLILKPDLYVLLEISIEESISRQRTAKAPELSSMQKDFLRTVQRSLVEFHSKFLQEVPRLRVSHAIDVNEIIKQMEISLTETWRNPIGQKGDRISMNILSSDADIEKSDVLSW